MNIVRAFFSKTRAFFFNFEKKAWETSPLPHLVTRLRYYCQWELRTRVCSLNYPEKVLDFEETEKFIIRQKIDKESKTSNLNPDIVGLTYLIL